MFCNFIQHHPNYAGTDCFYASYIYLISTPVQNKKEFWALPRILHTDHKLNSVLEKQRETTKVQ